MPAAPVNRAAKRQRTLPQMMGTMINPMMMMHPMMGGGVAPMMMGGCNMMGPMNGMMMGGMMNPAAMMNGQMMEEHVEEDHDGELGAVQDGPQRAAGVDEPQHEPPPVINYNKTDEAAITRSASMIRGLGGTCMQPV